MADSATNDAPLVASNQPTEVSDAPSRFDLAGFGGGVASHGD
jgi:hypothetical protein